MPSHPNYPYFGADIHAVAGGPVVAVVDGLPEQIAGKDPTGLPLDQYGGNHIVQDIGGGNYAFYELTMTVCAASNGCALWKPPTRTEVANLYAAEIAVCAVWPMDA